MGMTPKLIFAEKPQKKVIVFSHERSGTHFLMNTLAENFGYITNSWVNLDLELGVHFYSPHIFHQMFQQLHDKPVLNIFKSHHSFAFVENFIEYLTDQFHVFYVYRDPRDVMVSFRRILEKYDWDRGPKAATVGEFMRAEPLGDILRYQKRQMPTILHRWVSHVEGWIDCQERLGKDKVFSVYYDDLDTRFNATVQDIGKHIDHPITSAKRPEREHNVISPGKGGSTHHKILVPEDYEFVKEVAGKTMERLGILW